MNRYWDHHWKKSTSPSIRRRCRCIGNMAHSPADHVMSPSHQSDAVIQLRVVLASFRIGQQHRTRLCTITITITGLSRTHEPHRAPTGSSRIGKLINPATTER